MALPTWEALVGWMCQSNTRFTSIRGPPPLEGQGTIPSSAKIGRRALKDVAKRTQEPADLSPVRTLLAEGRLGVRGATRILGEVLPPSMASVVVDQFEAFNAPDGRPARRSGVAHRRPRSIGWPKDRTPLSWSAPTIEQFS